MKQSAHRAALTLSRRWLRGVGAAERHYEPVVRDVQLRLASLPSMLGLALTPVDACLASVPHRMLGTAARVPVASEYARLVESLTAVAYYDLVEREGGATVPRQREANQPSAGVERV